MGRLNYWFGKPISLSDFNKRLAELPVNYETNYRPRLPFVRILFDDLKMVAKTNINGDVVKLKPLDAHMERHLLLAQAIADLCDTTITVDDWSAPAWNGLRNSSNGWINRIRLRSTDSRLPLAMA